MIGSFDGFKNFAGGCLRGASHKRPINMTAGFQQMAMRSASHRRRGHRSAESSASKQFGCSGFRRVEV
jgi:hypothetical protein